MGLSMSNSKKFQEIGRYQAAKKHKVQSNLDNFSSLGYNFMSLRTTSKHFSDQKTKYLNTNTTLSVNQMTPPSKK